MRNRLPAFKRVGHKDQDGSGSKKTITKLPNLGVSFDVEAGRIELAFDAQTEASQAFNCEARCEGKVLQEVQKHSQGKVMDAGCMPLPLANCWLPGSLDKLTNSAQHSIDVHANKRKPIVPPRPGDERKVSMNDAVRRFDDSVDMKGFVEATVEGPERDKMHWQHFPAFIVLQAALILVGLVTVSMGLPRESDWQRVGLDAFFPGTTDLRIHSDCDDNRKEIWRWLSYQFSHASVQHALVNVVVLLLVGLPLEGFHGSWRTFATFQAGVFGGACGMLATDLHSIVVGMSGGCYALLGMHLGDLIMNWAERKYRRLLLLCMSIAAVLDVLNAHFNVTGANVSHSVHFGGYVAGALCGIVLGRNLVVKRWEIWLQIVVVALAVFLAAFSVSWIRQWPPRTILEAWDNKPGWCWARQVYDEAFSGDGAWHCVRCFSQQCIDKWASSQWIRKIGFGKCDAWEFTEKA